MDAKAARYKLKYGKWGYQPGVDADHSKCAEEVRRDWTYRQCTRKCGHGRDGAYCKQHAKNHEIEL